MLGMLLAATVAVYLREGWGGVGDGLKGTWDLMARALPVTLLGMTLAGMLQIVAPPGVVGRYMGEDSGLLGLAIGMGAGLIIPGGPYVMYPIGAALMTSGAGIGPMAGFVSARNLVTFNRLLVWELPFLGWHFTVTRILVSWWMPPATVALVPLVYRLMPQSMRDRGPKHEPARSES